MFDSFGIFHDKEDDESQPELHVGTITGVSSIMSGLQTISFGDRAPIYVENYGVRQLQMAAEHLGQESPVGMQIEFVLDDGMVGLIMQSFNILGNEENVACYSCQGIMERYIITEEEELAIANEEYEFDDLINGRYYMCAKCGHIYCPSCEDESCPYCVLMNPPTKPPVEP